MLLRSRSAKMLRVCETMHFVSLDLVRMFLAARFTGEEFIENNAQKSLFAFLEPSVRVAHLSTRSETMAARKNRKHDELGPDSAGQAGDVQQLSNVADADSESVEELVEEGNAFEADAVQGVEDAQDADVSEVTTRQVMEDDVPAEYLNDEDEHVA